MNSANIKIIGISGGSGSGKTTFADLLNQKINDTNKYSCQVIKQDNYYHDQSDKFDHDGGSVNFDHPSSIDFELMVSQVKKLKTNTPVKMPNYDFATHSRLTQVTNIEPTSFILIDGILLYTCRELLNILDHKLYVDCPEQIRFERRLKRDIEERGRTKEGVLAQFKAQVKPMHDEFVEPSKGFACDIINIENFDEKLDHWFDHLTTH